MAQYREGTVTVTSNSSTVIGSGTRWLAVGIEPGHFFSLRGQAVTYTVASVVSDTEIVLNGGYQGASASGQHYLIHIDFTARGYAVPGPNDVDATLIVRRALFEIDADLTAALGSPDGSSRAIRVSDLLDLNATTALTGQVFTKLADGSYGFTAPGALSIPLVNMTAAATNVGLLYAGTAANGSHQFRALQVVGAGTLTQNADRLTITVPPGGETNTLASLGSAQSVSLVAPKSGATLNTYGLRAGSNVTLVRDGNDVLISSVATGGTPTGGEANVGENLGGVGPNVVRVYSDKTGVNLRFRSLLFDTGHFTVTGEATGQYTVVTKRPRFGDLTGVDLTAATAGQVASLGNDGVWRGLTPPAPGIASVAADPQPRLGGNLSTDGNRVIGVANTLSGMIERPKSKNYTLILRANAPIAITAMSATCAAGSVLFNLFLGVDLADTPGGAGVAPISGSVTSADFADVAAASPMLVTVGSRLTLSLTPQTADAADFAFSIAYASA